jgi:hypothetical protein
MPSKMLAGRTFSFLLLLRRIRLSFYQLSHLDGFLGIDLRIYLIEYIYLVLLHFFTFEFLALDLQLKMGILHLDSILELIQRHLFLFPSPITQLLLNLFLFTIKIVLPILLHF